METNETRICLYCGKTIRYRIISDNWNLGHYGCNSPEISYVGYDCNCEPSKIAKDLKAKWIACCQNCKSNKNSECTNPKTLNDFIGNKDDSPFEKTKITKVPINKPEKKCRYYESIMPSSIV